MTKDKLYKAIKTIIGQGREVADRGTTTLYFERGTDVNREASYKVSDLAGTVEDLLPERGLKFWQIEQFTVHMNLYCGFGINNYVILPFEV